MHGYMLCRQWQDKKDGRHLDTELDMDKFKNLDLFLKELYKREEITEEEFNEVTSVYYD